MWPASRGGLAGLRCGCWGLLIVDDRLSGLPPQPFGYPDKGLIERGSPLDGVSGRR